MVHFIQDRNGIWVENSSKQSPSISYSPAWSDDCFSVEDASFWFSRRNALIVSLMKRFPFEKGFADIGGGNGYQAAEITKAFPHHPVYLVEPLYQGCQNAKKRGLKNMYQTIASRFPYRGKSIGGIGLFDVLEHITDDEAFLQKIVSLSPSKTRFYVTVPAYHSLWSDIDRISGHHRRYTVNDTLLLAGAAGLKTLYASYCFSYLTPLIFFTRRLPFILGFRTNPEKHLRTDLHRSQLSDHFSSIVKPLHIWEQTHVRNGKHIHFGSSVIAVFQKKS